MNHDLFLRAVSRDQRAAFGRVRDIVKDIIPDADENIRDGIAVFRWGGRTVVGYGPSRGICALYLFDKTTVEACAAQLTGVETKEGIVWFTVRKPLPEDVLRKLVQTRVSGMIQRSK